MPIDRSCVVTDPEELDKIRRKIEDVFQRAIAGGRFDVEACNASFAKGQSVGPEKAQ